MKFISLILQTDFTLELDPDKFSHIGEDNVRATTSVRKLTEGRNTQRKTSKDGVNLDDYQRSDPTPGTAPLAPGPIEHGTPHMPSIQKLRSPYPHKNVGSRTKFVRFNFGRF
ncbi:hypothetical protein Dsin_016064 [Dipteronia sinensis]|uniref:Uncharacterized protein n=1 Tax=Dipteronia sinensis TaxID=43782 RepID=A0AAE0E6K8_9ROSI|nr:hypothetical protein Dsin_016064 [Dipteronia sinensis]